MEGFQTLVDATLDRIETERADRKLCRLEELAKELERMDNFLTAFIEARDLEGEAKGSPDPR